MNDAKKALDSLKTLLSAGVSPFHAVNEGIRRLEEKGFQELELGSAWEVAPGGSYYVNLYGSSLVAFSIGKNVGADKTAPRFWPCLRIKPSPEMKKEGYGLLNVECYGGMLLQTWLDRPLSIAGRVCLRGRDAFHPEVRLIDFKRPLLAVPNLANHIKRESEKNAEPNKQIDMLPIMTAFKDQLEEDDFFLGLLAKEA